MGLYTFPHITCSSIRFSCNYTNTMDCWSDHSCIIHSCTEFISHRLLKGVFVDAFHLQKFFSNGAVVGSGRKLVIGQQYLECNCFQNCRALYVYEKQLLKCNENSWLLVGVSKVKVSAEKHSFCDGNSTIDLTKKYEQQIKPLHCTIRLFIIALMNFGMALFFNINPNLL